MPKEVHREHNWLSLSMCSVALANLEHKCKHTHYHNKNYSHTNNIRFYLLLFSKIWSRNHLRSILYYTWMI